MRRKVAYTTRLKEGSPGEERGESAKLEAAEMRSGTEATPAGPTTTGPANQAIPHSNGASVAGPVATAAPETPIPHAGRGGDGKPGAHGGLQQGHPQNIVAPARAGTGTDGGSSGAKGGESPSTLTGNAAGKSAKQPNPVDKKAPHRKTPAKAATGSNRISKGAAKNLGHFLGKVGAGRPN